jgi:hypothetical protein
MKRRAAALAGVLALAACAANAAPDARTEAEIRGLLAFVERSGCAFVRSGTLYDGAAARKHLERKYDSARPMLSTADQFVVHVASRSSVTGEAYRVRCGASEQPARGWLETELARMRAAAASGTARAQ